jgi:hypothetical protein
MPLSTHFLSLLPLAFHLSPFNSSLKDKRNDKAIAEAKKNIREALLQHLIALRMKWLLMVEREPFRISADECL